MKVALVCTDNEDIAFGLRSVSAALKAAGIDTRLVFLETEEKQLSTKALEAFAALTAECQIVGISSLAQGSGKAKQLLEYVKPLGKVTIWGGVHASLNPEECARWADCVCLGEGEGAMVEFVERIQEGRGFGDMLNAAYLENGVLVKNELRPLTVNLDDLPLPDFSLEDEYHLKKQGFEKIDRLGNVERHGMIAFISSRGCAFQCTYCCNIALKNLYAGRGHYVRRMSVGRLIEHCQELRRIFPRGSYFYFIDEDFSARPLAELQELAERFPKEVGLPFECLAHPARITEENLGLLVKAGLFRVRIGAETGSERTKREVYNRRVSNEAALQAAQLIYKFPQVAPVYFFMFANPYEERDDLLATLRLYEELPYGAKIQAFELIFFPGSVLFDRAVADRLIGGEYDSGYELNYYGGLHYQKYDWKKKNLYLNGLLFLAGSKCTRLRVGLIPRFLYRFLLREDVILFNEENPVFIQALIRMKGMLWRARYQAGVLVKKVLKDPKAFYNTGNYLREQLAGSQG